MNETPVEAALPVTMPQLFQALDPAQWGLREFDLPKNMVWPALMACRHINTAADALFYDVGVLWLRLYTRGISVTTSMNQPEAVASNGMAALAAAANILNLSAAANPEGAILLVDARRPPFVRKFDDVREFLANGLTFPGREAVQNDGAPQPEIRTITVTGVGSSALGAVAFAWNVSEALHQPVAAIVPGYGIADLIPQALGGWFAFGMHDFWRRLVGQALPPEIAGLGHHLARTAPNAAARLTEDPAVFRSGSPESDVLHDILEHAPGIKRLYGHSKGALCIQNAIRGLDPARYPDLHVTTFGCVIQEETAADYNQILGRGDALGQINSWGNWAEKFINGWHSTNSMLPGAMPIPELVLQDIRDEYPSAVSSTQLVEALKQALRELSSAGLPTLPAAQASPQPEH